jgi:hypothetical protein
MVMKAKELKEIHLGALAEIYDPMLARHGFARNRRSDETTRKLGESAQSIWLYCRPSRGKDNVIGYLGARLSIRFPGLSDIIGRLRNDGAILHEADGFVGAYQLRNLMPVRSPFEWSPITPDDFVAAETVVSEEIERWMIPFADETATEEGFVRLWEADDPRISFGYSVLRGVLAIYIDHGDIKKAKDLAHHIFDGKPELKTVYAPGLDFVFDL